MGIPVDALVFRINVLKHGRGHGDRFANIDIFAITDLVDLDADLGLAGVGELQRQLARLNGSRAGANP
jgi:hypothetical protein